MYNLITIKILLIILIIVYIIYNNNNKYEFYHLNIIIPIRDREQHLRKIIPRLIEIFKYQNIKYTIFLIEQSHGKSFNRAKLCNIGFLEAIKYNNVDNFLINDVDIYPFSNNTYNYRIYKNISHLYGYKLSLGGSLFIKKNTYIKINGFSNEYYGWGYEDEDIQYRVKRKGYRIDRSQFIQAPSKLVEDLPDELYPSNKIISNAIYQCKDCQEKFDNKILYEKHLLKCKKKFHKKTRIVFKKKTKLYDDDISNIYKDGINTCNYKIISKYYYENNKNIIRILVDF